MNRQCLLPGQELGGSGEQQG